MPIDEFAADFASGFDDLRKEILGPKAKLVLLRETDSEGVFSQIQEVTSGWLAEFSQFFGTTTFKVADISWEFGANVRQANHAVIRSSKLPEINDMLFEFQEDTNGPSPNVPWWSIRVKSLGRRYTTVEI